MERTLHYTLFSLLFGLIWLVTPVSDTAHAQNFPYLVKDSNQQFPSSVDDTANIVTMSDAVYFAATDPVNGYELWKSDGTAAGTVLVKDINPAGDSYPNRLITINETLFFMATDPINGYELWKSDGTAANTVLVKDITAGIDGSWPSSLTNVNGTLFFGADDPTNGTELWKSDGTAAGTVLVKDINPGMDGSSPYWLTDVNGILFFGAVDQFNGTELWKSDGTTAGTVLVKDIKPGAGISSPEYLTNVNGTLFFSATDPVNGCELWKSDGTAAGTVLVKDINPGADGSWPESLINVNGTLFFVASTPEQGAELWKSDGSSAGTVPVKDIMPGTAGSWPNSLVNQHGTLYFAAYDPITGFELWRSDGTSEGTMLAKDINPGNEDSWPGNLACVDDTLFFSATHSGIGTELWKSDGTVAGPMMAYDLNSGTDSSWPRNFTNMNGVLFFKADSPLGPPELWALDARPIAIYTPSALSFAPTAINSLSTPLSLTITNDGYTPLTITGTSMSGVNPGDFMVNAGSCGSTTPTLAAGASCILEVTFAPTETGDRGATLEINTNAPYAPLLSVSLSGTGSDLQDAVTLTVTVTGSGTVHSITYPATTDINCSGYCSQSYDSGRVVTLYSSDIADWSGCDSLINGDQCSVTMNSSKTVSVSFPEIPLCVYNYQCGTGFYCQKPTGSCSGLGTCAPQPSVCIQVVLPVCGCNGTTYSNSCFARNAGVSIAYNGSCGLNSCYAFYESVEDGDICWGMNWPSEILYANLPKTVRIGNEAILKGIVISDGTVEVTGLTLR